MRPVVLFLALLLVACRDQSPVRSEADPAGPAFAVADGSAAMQSARGDRWIVILADGESPRDVAGDNGVVVDHVFRRAAHGFAASMSDAARNRLLSDQRVLMIERDEPVATAMDPIEQLNAPWGLDRIDQRPHPLDGAYRYGFTGENVTVYVVDTGIRYTHEDFGGRARPGFDALGGNGSDCNGHGTHVAGIVGGSKYGVSKGVSLVSVRVLDCAGSGYTSSVIAGLDWIAANAVRPAVVNMSLGGGATSSMDDAVQRITAAGIPVIAAAGNSNSDACMSSPARGATVITVGSVDANDARSSFSNWGDCLNLFAPGRGVVSTWHTDNTATASLSGTSMAAPHVAGVAALILAEQPSLDAAQVDSVLSRRSSKDAVSDARSLRPDLVFARPGDDDSRPTPPKPVLTLPAAPSDLHAENTSSKPQQSSYVRLYWHDNADNEQGFEVRGSSSSGSNMFMQIYVADLTSTTVVLNPGEWEMQIRSYNAAGRSAWSDPVLHCVAGSGFKCESKTGGKRK